MDLVKIKWIFFTQFLFFYFLFFTTLGCSVKKWWGEPPVPQALIQLDSSRSVCSPPRLMFEGSDLESEQTLQCYVKELDKLWIEIKPSQESFFSTEELKKLFQKRIISTPEDPLESFQRVIALFKLLGIQSTGISINEYLSWIDFIKNNRKEARILYQFFKFQDHFSFDYYEKVFRLFRAFLEKTDLKMTLDSFHVSLKSFFGFKDEDFLKILPPALRLTWNSVGMICPTINDLSIVNAYEISQCLEKLPIYFKPAQAWLEYALNPVTVLPNLQSVSISLRAFEALAEKWLNKKELHPLKTRLLLDLVESFGAKPPDHFLESLVILKKFNEQSSQDFIHPLALVRVTQIIRRTGLSVLDGLPVYFNALESKKCLNKDAKTWKDCILPTEIEAFQQTFQTSEAFQIALKAKNKHYGDLATPFNGKRFQRIHLFNSIAEHLIDIFDTSGPGGVPDGLIMSEGKNDKDEVVQMLGVTLESMDSIERFVSNVKRKLNGQAVIEASPRVSLKQFDLKGLAQLLTFFSTDLLVEREKKEQISLNKLVAGLFKTFLDLSPESSVFLDQSSITSLLNYIDGLDSYWDGETQNFERKKVLSTLPKFFEAYFPRTFQGCKNFGFSKSCAIVFDELLSRANPEGFIERGDLDLITVIASLMEGLLDACDLNKNGFLELNILEPINLFSEGDELSCATKKISSAINRLIHSKIVNDSSATEFSHLLNFLKTNELTRVFGKVSLIDGSTRFMLLSPIRIHFEALRGILSRSKGKANLGSLYGLFADLLNSERARSPEAGQE